MFCNEKFPKILSSKQKPPTLYFLCSGFTVIALPTQPQISVDPQDSLAEFLLINTKGTNNYSFLVVVALTRFSLLSMFPHFREIYGSFCSLFLDTTSFVPIFLEGAFWLVFSYNCPTPVVLIVLASFRAWSCTATRGVNNCTNCPTANFRRT